MLAITVLLRSCIGGCFPSSRGNAVVDFKNLRPLTMLSVALLCSTFEGLTLSLGAMGFGGQPNPLGPSPQATCAKHAKHPTSQAVQRLMSVPAVMLHFVAAIAKSAAGSEGR